MFDLNTFNHFTEIQIRFKDIDAQGHVNNANHLTYAEVARVEYFKKVLGENINWNKTGLLLARTEIDYLEPIFLNDSVSVSSSVGRLGTKSFDMYNLIFKNTSNGQKTSAKIKSVFVCYDYELKSSIMVPEEWRLNFIKFEKHLN
ncbi:MAG: acyl-CoA thioesterase [Bacteroidota bacterium]|jgi:acyl-CoA thioester hydrolase